MQTVQDIIDLQVWLECLFRIKFVKLLCSAFLHLHTLTALNRLFPEEYELQPYVWAHDPYRVVALD